jgi:CarD family transcriptional regulator
MDYKIGDKVVYPNHGVGVVEQISYGVLNGRTERYFMIRIVSSGLRVMVPQSNAMTVGLRSVIRSTESTKVLGFLEKGKLNSHHDWKHRFKENSERMRTGALLEVAVVLKSLVSLSRSKPLSFREKKMLERAKYLLVSEMATSRNTTAENAEATVVKSLAKAKLTFPVMTEKFEELLTFAFVRASAAADALFLWGSVFKNAIPLSFYPPCTRRQSQDLAFF